MAGMTWRMWGGALMLAALPALAGQWAKPAPIPREKGLFEVADEIRQWEIK